MTLGTGRLSMAREAARVAESDDIWMREEPRPFRIAVGMMTGVAIVALFFALAGHVARCATLVAVLKDGNRMVEFVPALRMWQLHTVTCGTEVRLNMAGRARLAALDADNVGMGGGPRVALVSTGMVAGIAVAARFTDFGCAVTVGAAGFSGFVERPYMVVLGPANGVGHLETVAGIAELLLLVARRTRGIGTGEANAVSPGPIRFNMARRSGNHRERMARRARQGIGRVQAVAIETRLHGRLDGLPVDVRLERVARSASDGIRCYVVFGVVEDQGRRTVTFRDLVEIGMALRAPGELGIADNGRGWCRQFLGCRSSAGGTTGGQCQQGAEASREETAADHPVPGHVHAPALDALDTLPS